MSAVHTGCRVGLLVLSVAVGCTPEAVPDAPAPQKPKAARLGGSNVGGTNLADTNLAGANLAGSNLSGSNISGANLAGFNLSGTNLAGANLSGTNLSGTNLAGFNLSGRNLSAANLSGTNLGGANLAGANLGGANLSGYNLTSANLAGANLAGANLGGANLSGANLSGANLSGTNLSATNLAGANLSATNLAGLNLSGYNLSGVNLAAANLSGANLAGANLSGANLSATNLAGFNLSATNLSGANLSGANLSGTNLSASNLGAANLSATNLAGANLAGANLAGANYSAFNLAGLNLAGVNLAGFNLSGVNLSGVNLTGANLSATNLSATNLSATNLSGANLSATNLAGANLAGANLSGTNLAGANTTGANLAGANTGIAANLSGYNLSGYNLAGANLAGFNLAAANLSGTNLTGANLSGANLSFANLAGANLSSANLSGANLSGSNYAAANLAGANLASIVTNGASPNLASANLSNANLAGANLSGTNLSGANLAGANFAGANLSGLDLSGLNLADISLAGANASDAAANLTTGRLIPGGDSALPSGLKVTHMPIMGTSPNAVVGLMCRMNSQVTMFLGPTTFDTAPADPNSGYRVWEAAFVVRGASNFDMSYVMLVPKPDSNDAIADGVAGFVKGLWYVSAPPTCSLTIKAFGGSYPSGSAFTAQVATGMFEAGNLFLTNQIDGPTVIDALRTLAAAKVNNMSVMLNWTMVFSSPSGPIVRGSMTAAESAGVSKYEATWFPMHPDYAPSDVAAATLPGQVMLGDQMIGVTNALGDPPRRVFERIEETAIGVAKRWCVEHFMVDNVPQPSANRCSVSRSMETTYSTAPECLKNGQRPPAQSNAAPCISNLALTSAAETVDLYDSQSGGLGVYPAWHTFNSAFKAGSVFDDPYSVIPPDQHTTLDCETRQAPVTIAHMAQPTIAWRLSSQSMPFVWQDEVLPASCAFTTLEWNETGTMTRTQVGSPRVLLHTWLVDTASATRCETPVSYYLDQDGDGRRSPTANARMECGPSSHLTVSPVVDCNDFDARAFTGAVDNTKDESDNDCDGYVDNGFERFNSPTLNSAVDWVQGQLSVGVCSGTNWCGSFPNLVSGKGNTLKSAEKAGKGVYTGKITVWRTGLGTASVNVSLVESFNGNVVGITATSVTIGTTGVPVQLSRTVTDPTHTIRLEIRSSSTATMTLRVDDASLKAALLP